MDAYSCSIKLTALSMDFGKDEFGIDQRNYHYQPTRQVSTKKWGKQEHVPIYWARVDLCGGVEWRSGAQQAPADQVAIH